MEPAAPRLDTLAPELIARVCIAGRTRELARLGAVSRALIRNRDCVTNSTRT